ncbi:hypothetical protein [Thiocapsa sp. N5-Cardenillas]|uniref:hypothetical protein n=1 Tax=Thiocapsa sp. N5-Cardenillas TaxID=3137397 RepID=UPI0035B0B036
MKLLPATIMLFCNVLLVMCGQSPQMAGILTVTALLALLAIPGRQWLYLFEHTALSFIILFLFITGWQLIGWPTNKHVPFSVIGFGVSWVWVGWFCMAAFYLALSTPNMQLRRDDIERHVLWIATIIGIMGLIQYYIGAGGFYNLIPYYQQFFGTFGYINNAASFFFLAAALALHRSWRNLPLVILFAWIVHVCECRALLPCFLALLLAKSINRRVWWGFIPLIGIAAFWRIDSIMQDRWFESEANIRLWLHYPLFGTGPFGHFKLAPAFAPAFIKPLLNIQPNTHCDLIVFLAEYGAIGVTLLGLWFLIAVRRVVWHSVAGVAVLLTVLHSMMDMPFRNPAVVLMMLVVVQAGSQGRLRTRVSL